MGCLGCSVSTNGSKPGGCKNNGGCSSGGCNRLNTFDWLSSLDVEDSNIFNVLEVTFKNGARKSFFRLPEFHRVVTGDMVVVETGNGYDVGKISLSGELVRLQMKKKRVTEDNVLHSVIRRANDRDMQKLQEAREMEYPTMLRARAIARTLDLEMKIGDVEYQGDKRKATFYYTADGRVDFRELIRHYAKEFRVKIEMRQIGARQESARIGGHGVLRPGVVLFYLAYRFQIGVYLRSPLSEFGDQSVETFRTVRPSEMLSELRIGYLPRCAGTVSKKRR